MSTIPNNFTREEYRYISSHTPLSIEGDEKKNECKSNIWLRQTCEDCHQTNPMKFQYILEIDSDRCETSILLGFCEECAYQNVIDCDPFEVWKPILSTLYRCKIETS